MVRLDMLDTPITTAQLQGFEAALTNLQGNILRGHGRGRSVHIFLQFNAESEKIKDWIHDLAGHITSAKCQLDEAERFRNSGTPGELFVNFFLSAEGYRHLGCDLTGHSQAFQDGMRAASERLQDPDDSTWEPVYRQPIHAMVLLAHHDENFLRDQAKQCLDTIRSIAKKDPFVEYGKALQNKHEENIEHFGYVDGRSQPLFFERDIERERTERDGTSVWPPDAGPSLVIVKEPKGDETDCGSYLVFRKLEQNVYDFKKTERRLAKKLGLTGKDKERAGALVVGRFEDGTPVVLQRSEGMHAPVPNNFTYADDPDGLKCPFQAHIRKVNPRGELHQRDKVSPNAPERESLHRIARRGIPYGEREKEPKDDPDIEELPKAGVGLLFMCYQRDIANQFEFLQRRLANNPNHLREQTGIDPIIGQTLEGAAAPQQWPAKWGASREPHEPLPFSFYGMVRLKGGEYFFAPSIRFLQTI